MVRLSALVIALGVSACSSGAADPVTPAASSDEPSLTVPTTATSTAPVESAAPAGSRELSATDCRALAGKYNALTRSDEMAKLPEGLTPEQIAVAARQLEAGAEILSTRWETGCVESLVGKESPEANLRCAMSAKTVAAFDVCLNGPSEPPPESTPKR